jgi:hypothetical protein
MKKTILLPNSWRKWGWLILLPTIVLGVLMNSITIEPEWLNIPTEPFDFRLLHDDFIGHAKFENMLNELITTSMLIGLFMVCFSREKEEDELIANLRLQSLLWMVYSYCALLLVANYILYGGWFLNFMMYNLFTPLFVYFFRFKYLIYQLKKD